jgi:tRNA pseudouridine38-40 synthase
VQGEIEGGLRKVLGREVVTVGAGRTDAGVHALGQVMSTADAPEDPDTSKVRAALNALCGPAVSVARIAPAPLGWHARFDARSRTYVYALHTSPVHDPWLARTALHHPHALDLDAMNEAAGHLLGDHDFSSFGRAPDGASAVRTLFELRSRRAGDLVRVRARANSFIQQMVRSLVGTLLQVGAGRRSPDEMVAVLAARDRAAAGPVAPPHGLCLVSVEYDEGWSGPVGASSSAGSRVGSETGQA